MRERARVLTGSLTMARKLMMDLSGARDDAVRRLRADGASCLTIGRAIGVSTSRAQQICARLERPPRHP